MKEDIMKLIAGHNIVVDTLERVGQHIVVRGLEGAEIWHSVACQGANIVDVARALGMDARIDMQSGRIVL